MQSDPTQLLREVLLVSSVLSPETPTWRRLRTLRTQPAFWVIRIMDASFCFPRNPAQTGSSVMAAVWSALRVAPLTPASISGLHSICISQVLPSCLLHHHLML